MITVLLLYLSKKKKKVSLALSFRHSTFYCVTCNFRQWNDYLVLWWTENGVKCLISYFTCKFKKRKFTLHLHFFILLFTVWHGNVKQWIELSCLGWTDNKQLLKCVICSHYFPKKKKKEDGLICIAFLHSFFSLCDIKSHTMIWITLFFYELKSVLKSFIY